MRRHFWKAVLALLPPFFVVLAGCGGGAGGGTPPPPPAKTVTSVTATATPATLQLVASGSQPTSQIAVTVSYSDGTSSASLSLVTLTMSPSAAGTISAAGVFTPSTSITSQTQVTITATSTENTAKSGTATITVNPVPVAPTITLSASAATVAFGNGMNFTFTTTGSPTPGVTCGVALVGTTTCSVSGNTVSYAVSNPASAPASFVDTLTVTARNSAGSAGQTATINLVASITSATVHGSVDPQAVFCVRYNCGVNVDIVGTGFFSASGFMQDLVAPVNGNVNAAFMITDSAHASMTALVGKTDFRPKAWHIGYREPGPCCGFDSNVKNFVFLGNLDTMDISTTDAFQLNQSTGTVQKFKLADGSLDGSFQVGNASFGLAVNDTTPGYVVVSGATGFNIWNPDGSNPGIGGGDVYLPLSVSAKGGYVCGSEDQAGEILSFQLTLSNSTIPLIVGNTPWQTAMLTLQNQLACTVFNIGDLVFTVAPIPIPATPAPLWTLTVQGITPLSQVPGGDRSGNFTPNGGWPLIVSQSASKAAVLSRYDRKAAIIDLLAKTQTHTVDLAQNLGGGIILRMAVDNTHQKAVISLAQTATETSTFISVYLATGTISPMSATTPFYATDLRVSADGTTLYCGDSAGKFLRVTNN